MQTGSLQCLAQGNFGLVPYLIRADTLVRAQCQLHHHIGKSEIGINLAHQFVEGCYLGLDLVFGAENVAVVLREAADPHDAVQGAGRLAAMARAKFAIT